MSSRVWWSLDGPAAHAALPWATAIETGRGAHVRAAAAVAELVDPLRYQKKAVCVRFPCLLHGVALPRRTAI
jgi:hypothetical protein